MNTLPLPSTTPRVAVVGASGYIGTNLVPRLVERGMHVRAVARSREVLAARGWPGVELAAADVLKPETLDAALQDIDIAYYLVHCMRRPKGSESIEKRKSESKST